MKKIKILSEDAKGSAISNMADVLSASLSKRGFEVEIVFSVNSIKDGGVILLNLLPHEIAKINVQMRYKSFKKIITIFSPNPREYESYDLLSILIQNTATPRHLLIAHSSYSYHELSRYIIQSFTGSLSRNTRDRMKMIPFGVDVGKFQFKKGDKNKFIVPTNRVNDSQKQITLNHELSSKIKSMHKDVEFNFIVNPKFRNEEKEELFKNFNIIEQQNDSYYTTILQQSGMAISTSKFESFGLYYIEAILSGVLVVFLDAPWVHKLMPNYPFVFKKDEIVLGVDMILKDYDRWYGMFKVHAHSLRKKYDVEKFVDKLIKLI